MCIICFGHDLCEETLPKSVTSLETGANIFYLVSGVLAALNELRHCAPINLKATLALELQCALQSVANSLLRYNATRIVKDSEKTLFLAMCRAFIEVLSFTLLVGHSPRGVRTFT